MLNPRQLAVALLAGCVGCTAKPAIVEYASLSVCRIAKSSSGLVQATVTGIGSAQNLPPQGNVLGTRATDVTVAVTRVVFGTRPLSDTVLVSGEVASDCASEQGPLKQGGSFSSGYFFFVDFGGRSHLYGGQGFFWGDGGTVSNRFVGGISEPDFLAEVAAARDGGMCPSRYELPDAGGASDSGLRDGGPLDGG